MLSQVALLLAVKLKVPPPAFATVSDAGDGAVPPRV